MKFRNWLQSGEPYIWLNAGAVTVSILMVAALVLLIAVKGLAHFWPDAVVEFEETVAPGETQRVIGEIANYETAPAVRAETDGVDATEVAEEELIGRYLIQQGNRDFYGTDFRWIPEPAMSEFTFPEKAMTIERREWGNVYGYLKAIRIEGTTIDSGDSLWAKAQDYIGRANEVFEEIRHIEKDLIGSINYQIERLRLEEKQYRLEGVDDPAVYEDLEAQRAALQEEYESYTEELAELYRRLNQGNMVVTLSDGRAVEIPFAKVVRAYRPNAMGALDKAGFYLEKLWEFVSDEPREANTEGGIFPAIFGTIMMVMLMAVLVTPFGVIAAVYLREYATQGPLTRAIRIAVNNLAGVPSVVYGVFGLGFFVYFLGGHIDQLFFPAALPQPTFGTPGLLWASLTLAILTLPVVIVATEEGLTRVPRSIREGSLALGATKAETLWRTVLPMTASAMMTGLILAVARAAGEVAPLMLVGVVKLAPSLPLDGNFPYLHLDRKFMHLGFHIYDVGFQSPNVEAARPLVYATALLLLLIIIVLNLTAIRIRNRLREKYRAAEQN